MDTEYVDTILAALAGILEAHKDDIRNDFYMTSDREEAVRKRLQNPVILEAERVLALEVREDDMTQGSQAGIKARLDRLEKALGWCEGCGHDLAKPTFRFCEDCLASRRAERARGS